MKDQHFYCAPAMSVVPAVTVQFAGELYNLVSEQTFLAVGADATPEGPALFIGIRCEDGDFIGGATTAEHAQLLHARLGDLIERIIGGEFDKRVPS